MDKIVNSILLPESYFHRFNFSENQASFVQMNRKSFKTSPFLDNRINCISDIVDNISLDICLDTLDSSPQKQPIKIIFHTAYCCSTLLSRALDLENKTLVYREPVTLHQLAVMKRRRQQFTEHYHLWNRYLNFTFQMLAKTWGRSETAIIKATDSCNNIITEISEESSHSPAILLYSRLEDFIASNLKSEGRRNFLKNFVIRSSKDAINIPILHSIDPATLNDAKSATYVWMVQIILYLKAINLKNHRTLDAADLLKSPINYLSKASEHFDLNLDTKAIKEIIDGPAWNKHAKNTEKASFSSKDRSKEKEKVINDNKSEVDEAIKWAFSFANWEDYIKQLKSISL